MGWGLRGWMGGGNRGGGGGGGGWQRGRREKRRAKEEREERPQGEITAEGGEKEMRKAERGG